MYARFFKRLFDVLGALCLLPLVLLVVVIFAPLIWLTDKGPIFYNATRAGKDYLPFKMFKLRSMYVNAPDIRNSDGSTFNSDEDPRVTPVGRFLRQTSLDEFPQFLNVLLGDMSFIGPRPKLYCPEKYPNGLPSEKAKSFKVKPGVTGYAQAYYRNSISQDEKFYWDGYYAENISFKMDALVIWKTAQSVLARRNINSRSAQ